MNVGILGFAHGHVHAYINQWKARPELGITVTGGWDHDAARLQQCAESFGLTPFASMNDLLAGGVEAVVVGAETSLHAECVEAAAAAGKAIVVQKPMALTLEQADRMVAAVEAAGVPFTMAWQMRVDPQNLAMKEMVASGRLGKILMVRRRHGLATHTWQDFEKSWHASAAYNRDMWADDASHPADFLYWLLGMPASVSAELASLVNPAVPNDNGVAVFRYAGGTIAEICCSFTCLAAENTTEIIGADGVMVQNYGDLVSANHPRPEGAVGLKYFLRSEGKWAPSGTPEVASHGERIMGLAGPLAEFLHGRRGPIATAREGRDVLRMILACYESSAGGRRVSL